MRPQYRLLKETQGTIATTQAVVAVSAMSAAPAGGNMQRNFSVEDIMGSLTKMNSAGGGFPRTDSEQAFQEFLKRIPSSNSLAAFGSHGSQLDSAAQGVQFSTIQQVANQAAAAYVLPSGSVSAADGGGTALLGVPRVASLDFFRQLLPVNQLNFAGSRPAAVAEGNEESGEGGAANMTVGGQPGQQDMGAGVTPFHPPPPFAAGHPALPAVVCTPTVRRAAEALQAQNTRRSSSTTSGDGNTSSQPGGGSGRYGRSTADGPAKDGSKVELRRARRMLSNRESARRSRRRKQEHLGDLETKIQQLQDEKEDLQEEMEAAQKECAAERANSAALRRQLEQIKAHFMGGGGIVSGGYEIGGGYVGNGGSVGGGSGEVAADTEVPSGTTKLDPGSGHNGSAEWTGVERRMPRVASFPRVASAENLPSRKRIADGEAPPIANGHRRKRTPQAADI